ncbi:hypothetical protein [Halovenus sp. HT40]|uniref:hypothetical protein n=1 Tax=Halovenus sp. HT40 TaxID=3126691 RepID=UPI00300EE04A
MSDEPPTPPAELPTEIVNTLNGNSPDQLQHVARDAEELAEHKAREARLEKELEMTATRGSTASRRPSLLELLLP